MGHSAGGWSGAQEEEHVVTAACERRVRVCLGSGASGEWGRTVEMGTEKASHCVGVEGMEKSLSRGGGAESREHRMKGSDQDNSR